MTSIVKPAVTHLMTGLAILFRLTIKSKLNVTSRIAVIGAIGTRPKPKEVSSSLFKNQPMRLEIPIKSGIKLKISNKEFARVPDLFALYDISWIDP
jgi:hypothetical protein